MTAPSNPTPSTLDAAVEAGLAALDAVDAVTRGWLDDDDARTILLGAWPILAAGHADQLAQAHAAGTAAGAAAERERIAKLVRDACPHDDENEVCSGCWWYSDLILEFDEPARAGTSGVDRG